MKANRLTFITDLQAIERRAHDLGLHITAQAINKAVQAVGYEFADQIQKKTKRKGATPS